MDNEARKTDNPAVAKRGHYGSHLSDPSRKVPKTSYYRHAKQQIEIETAINESETSHDDEQLELADEVEEWWIEAEGISSQQCDTDSLISEPEILTQDSMHLPNENTCATTNLDSLAESPTEFDTHGHLTSVTLNEEPALLFEDDFSDIIIDPDQHFADDNEDTFEDFEIDYFENTYNSTTADSDCNIGMDNNDETEAKEMGKESLSVPLFEGAKISFAVSMLLIITYAMRHSLTGVALADLLLLIEVHLIYPNHFGKSMAVLRNFFKQLKNPLEYHYYCTFCFEYVGTNKQCKHCPNKHCLKDFSVKGSLGYFIIIPLVCQLQALLSREEIPDLLRYPSKRTKKNGENVEDLYDGRIYKKHLTPDGFFKGTNDATKDKEIHLSLQMNTDGVSLFRSSKYSIWPVYFLVNELPPKCRQQRKYRMFAGLWFGNSKPNFQTFMQPFAVGLKHLYYEGTPVKINEVPKTLRCILLFGTFDAPAKCLFQEFCQFNAFYGCPYCLSPGETVKTSANGHTHAYPFDETNLTTGHGRVRDHEQTLQFAGDATKKTVEDGKRASVKGVKGFSWFAFVPKFDIIQGIAIDYMHGTLLGVVKMLLTLWINKSYSKESWSVSRKISEIESRYLRMSPPSCITRLPRSLISNFGHMKASELRTFLLFYSVPCLYGILTEEYFQHYILLVESIYLLLQESISFADLNKATAMLKHFCIKIEELYGARYQTYNVHCLLHLTERVRDLGPLWTHSCFCYEDFNGELRNLFHGTQSVEEQIVLAVSIQQKLPELTILLPEGSLCKGLYDKMMHRNQVRHKKEQIGESCFTIGTLKATVLTRGERAVVESVVGPVSTVLKFHRVMIGDQIIHCKQYKLMTKRNNLTVEYNQVEPLGSLS